MWQTINAVMTTLSAARISCCRLASPWSRFRLGRFLYKNKRKPFQSIFALRLVVKCKLKYNELKVAYFGTGFFSSHNPPLCSTFIPSTQSREQTARCYAYFWRLTVQPTQLGPQTSWNLKERFSFLWFINRVDDVNWPPYRDSRFPLYGGQFTWSNPLINKILVLHSPADAAPQFV